MTDTPPTNPPGFDPADVPVIDTESDTESDTARFSDPVMFRKLSAAEVRDLEKREI